MPWRFKRHRSRCIGLLMATVFQGMAAHAQTAVSFQCPARVLAQAATLEESSELQGFAARFSESSPAHLLRITVQEGSGKEASDIKPQVQRQRRTWDLPSERKEPTSVWCHYEGGIALARVIRPTASQCEAEVNGNEDHPPPGAGRSARGLGRVSVVCQ